MSKTMPKQCPFCNGTGNDPEIRGGGQYFLSVEEIGLVWKHIYNLERMLLEHKHLPEPSVRPVTITGEEE